VKLEILDLGHNQLTTFDQHSLDNLKELSWFVLQNNQLTSLHRDTFKNNGKLVDLYLGQNKFVELSSTMFSHLTKLNVLSLEMSNCIDKIYPKRAYSRMAQIEKDLRQCEKN
jgi:Leucine-rich repeat (LRR) protein